MSLERSIQSGKEKRREYRDSRAIAPSCRNHKGCPICEGNRLYQRARLNLEANQERASLSDREAA